MAPKCGVCHTEESKYKCPVCELRYCSIACYKFHKPAHAEVTQDDQTKAQSQPKKDRPGTTQRVPKLDFTGFEKDKDLIKLLERYPLLKVQLSTAYGLTLEPGPDEARSWNRNPLPALPGYAPTPAVRGWRGHGRFRGGRSDRGGRGRGGWNVYQETLPEDRERGRWTQEKGDKEAMKMISKMKEGQGNWRNEDEAAEGMREFVQLVRLKFGDKMEDGQG